MAGMENKAWKEFLGKEIIVFYYDNIDHISRKVGILKNVDDDYLFLEVEDKIILIPKDKTIRIEVENKLNSKGKNEV